MSNYSLIIFDCDGTLVDSEVITNKVFAQMLSELGIFMTPNEVFETFVGQSMQQCLAQIRQMADEEPPSDFLDDYHNRTVKALEANLQPVTGIHRVLEILEVPYCVASSGSHAKMQKTLGITNLLPKFEGQIYSVHDVENGKPAPDVFLYAARQNNVSPAECAVIEDTPIGVKAGINAGMTVFGYAAHTPAEWLRDAGADHVFDSMADLPGLLKEGISNA
ncbi:MAG: HAD family hydrolase [Balneolaceae bacterium]|nr:HAD family hydrolase [Balneolaceae bacterium]